MDLRSEKWLEDILSEESSKIPSEPLQEQGVADRMELPPWFDAKLYKSGQQFVKHNLHAITVSMFLTIPGVFVVPNILKVILAMKKYTNTFNNYHRFKYTISTITTWFMEDLVPGSNAWKSIEEVRKKHIRASLTARLYNNGLVSQKEIAVTLWAFMGLPVLKPDHLGMQPHNEKSWEGYLHFWRTIGYIMGLEDRYNICSKSVTETREICQLMLDRLFTPLLENVCEYNEHITNASLEGLNTFNPIGNARATMYFMKYLCNVPGYVYYESERMQFYDKLCNLMKTNYDERGVESAKLVDKCMISGVSEQETKYYHPNDYKLTKNIPQYAKLSLMEKNQLGTTILKLRLCSITIFRIFLNFSFIISSIFLKYFPLLDFIRYGKKVFYDIHTVLPRSDQKPKPNSEIRELLKTRPWYIKWIPNSWNDTIYI